MQVHRTRCVQRTKGKNKAGQAPALFSFRNSVSTTLSICPISMPSALAKSIVAPIYKVGYTFFHSGPTAQIENTPLAQRTPTTILIDWIFR
jgi:hypothetical protein